ncbi:hypothetical protein EDD11_005340 [Mortierella claussenii]|nr:hypothetical protein EDD11_005340 [Mortierella claussenii]
MASMIPIAGSAYTYAYASIGELAAWIIGWDLILEYLVGAATVSVGWSSYMVAFLGDAFDWQISPKWTRTPIRWDGATFHKSGDYFNAPAFFITAVVSVTIYFGIHMTARINNYLVVFKVLVLIIVIFSMIPFIKPENYHPYIPEATGGVSGMLAGASTVFFAYIGFDSISTTAQEAKEPQVNLPVGIMATIVIATVLYVGISVVTVGVANYTTLDVSSPVVDAVRLTGMHWLVVLTELGALAATTSVILVLLIAQPRVFYAMANDGLIPPLFAKVHPKYKTPYMSTLISGVICSICGGLLPIQVLSDISSVGTIFAYFVVNIGVIILRYTRKTVPRRFKVPGGIGAASSLLLLQGARQEAIIRLLVWMALGLLVYAFYGRNHSEVNNPRLIVDEPMRVLQENFSVDSISYHGYTDDDLRQQYARQLARRMDYDRPRQHQRYSDYMDGRLPSHYGAQEPTSPTNDQGSLRSGQFVFDDGSSSHGGIDSGHVMAADMATPSHTMRPQDIHTSLHGSSKGSALSSATDQDALFDKIMEKVPPQKREFLSTSWSKDYLNRLTSLPARALHNEPEKLREEQLKVERDMSELAFRDYKAFILVNDCKQDVQSTFETLGQHLDHFQETVPKFVETLSGFTAKASPILERQHVFSSILATHSQLLEVLEIPLLMETCVRNGYYNEALELSSHVQRLVSRYPGIGIIQEIELKVAQGKEMMLVQLLAQLREPLKLPVALRITGFLRRIGSFSGQLEMVDEEEQYQQQQEGQKPATASSRRGNTSTSFGNSSNTNAALTEEDETPLKMLFLKSRGLYMNLQLSRIVFHKGDSFGYLKKYIDVTRECLFDIMTYYKSVFGNTTDNHTGYSSLLVSSTSSDSRGTHTPPVSGVVGGEQHCHNQQKQHCWTTENLLADFVTYRTQMLFNILRLHIPQIHDTSALSSILTQLMYFGANMAKIGFDIRYLVTSFFEEAVIRIVGGAFQRGADEFLDSLGGEGRHSPDWLIPSQWMISSTGRGPTISSLTTSTSTSLIMGRSSSSSDVSTELNGSSSSSSMSPQSLLMDYPALAYLTNSYLTALNSLRLLAPLSLAIPLREILVDSLMRVDLALEEYDQFIFGNERPGGAAFVSTLRRGVAPPPRSTQAGQKGQSQGLLKIKGMEGSKVLNEQKTMDGFLVVYKRAVQDYILRCFDEGIYGGLVHVDVDDDHEEPALPVAETDTEADAETEVETQTEAKVRIQVETGAEGQIEQEEGTKSPTATISGGKDEGGTDDTGLGTSNVCRA